MQAKWIGCTSDKYFDTDQRSLVAAKAQYYRKNFEFSKMPVKAELEIAALGIFKAFINGKSVSGEYFAPGWTNYRKRILKRIYDVTDLVEKNNAIAVCVGDGWYAGNISIKGRRLYGEYPLSLYAVLTVTYKDGSTEEIVTDESWKGGLGAVRENDFLYGEIYDTRLPHAEISLPDFNDKGFESVKITEDKTHLLDYVDYEPILAQGELKGTLVKVIEENKLIYDFGQNFAGVVRIKAAGPEESKIIIRHGEMLNADGTLYTANLRIAKATDTVILHGKSMVEYSPTFTYHGFRYVEITCTQRAEVIEITGVVLHNDLKRTGRVETSNPLVNKLISNVEWGMRSNFVDLPTDCPQRNERMGWSADTQVFSRSAMYIANCKKFYEKHLVCIEDDRDGGKIPDVVPYFGVAPFDSTGWRDVCVVLPYNLYQIYGDKEKTKTYIPMINDFFHRQQETAVDYIWEKCNYNDWLNIDHECDNAVLSGLINLYVFSLIIELFNYVGEDASEVIDYTNKVREKFISAFMSDGGVIKQGTQTVYALAYVVGLITKEQAVKLLTEQFALKNNHIHSGFLGIRFILPVLCDIGLVDLAYELICCDTYPSWGYSIVNGATTIWERWDSWTIEKGFQDEIMNSFNHYSLGSCGEWFYEYMLGIKPLEVAFKKVKIKPFVDKTGRITSVSGSFDSVNGKISVSWKKVNDGFVCDITKPSSLFAAFEFDGVTKIVQDGEVKTEFDAFANHTTVYFN